MSLIKELETRRIGTAYQPYPIDREVAPGVVASLESNTAVYHGIPDAYLYKIGFQMWATATCQTDELEETHKLVLEQLHHVLYEEFRGKLHEALRAVANNDRRGAHDILYALIQATYGRD